MEVVDFAPQMSGVGAPKPGDSWAVFTNSTLTVSGSIIAPMLFSAVAELLDWHTGKGSGEANGKHFERESLFQEFISKRRPLEVSGAQCKKNLP